MESKPFLTLVTLFTRSGQVVTEVYVPNYSPPPEVVIWGQRYFTYQGGRYLEGLAYIVPTELTIDGTTFIVKEQIIPDEENRP